jgi:hypothetical protein
MSFTNPQKKNPEESNLENDGVREWPPLFLSNDQETPCPKRHEHNGRSGLVHHLTGKLFSQCHDKAVFIMARSVTCHRGFFKQRQDR